MGDRAIRSLLIAVGAVVGLGACGDPTGDEIASAQGGDADAIVVPAIEEALAAEHFRGHVYGDLGFGMLFDETRHQSGHDYMAVTIHPVVNSATVLAGHTVHDWRIDRWDSIPRHSYDPLVSPGALFEVWKYVVGGLDDEGVSAWRGWVEVDNSEPGARRFSTNSHSSALSDPGELRDDAIPREVEEHALRTYVSERAEVEVFVEIDDGGQLRSAWTEQQFQPEPQYSDCRPLQSVTGTTRLRVDFSQIGQPFEIVPPDPETMLADYPGLEDGLLLDGPAPDEAIYLNPDGTRDLSNCPVPQ